MKIETDWHIHSHNSCDAASMKMPEIIEACRKMGIVKFGVTDHFNTRINMPDIIASRKEYLENRIDGFHFGIEVSCVSKWEIEQIGKGLYQDAVYGIREGGPAWCELAIDITAEQLETLGVEYVIGGTHWPLYVEWKTKALIMDYHRQNMFLANHPLITIVAHPWWFHAKYWGKYVDKYQPWFEDFRVIPSSMHDEFADAVVKNNKIVEINLHAILLHPAYPEKFKMQYIEYLAFLKSKGTKFAIGSDSHQPYNLDFEKAGQMIEKAGIKQQDLWSVD
ncbi:MAG: PHP domain-containing protein [Candidatus Omnitrophica bacterium]|nr:PHP domain-containing protein [Candidatus Omnitrophota bacterium]